MLSYEFGTPPYRHQVDYLERSDMRRAYALFSDMGTGKSKMLIDEMAMLWEAGLLDTVFITTYKGNYATWPDEIEKHMPRRIPRCVHLWDGSDSQRARLERRELLGFSGLAVLVMNIEAVDRSRKAHVLAMQFMGRGQKRMSVVDESPAIKEPEALRTKAMVKIAAVSEYRRIACGNPTPNSPLDLWGQFLFLGRGSGEMLGFNSYYSFRARYAYLKDQHIGNGRTVQKPYAWKNLEELQVTLAKHSFRVRKEECLDLPPKIYSMRHVEMTPEQWRVYKDVKDRAWSKLSAESTVSAVMVMGQRIKLHQVLCGMVIDDDQVVRLIPNNRITAMAEVVEEAGHQTIVWCAYRANALAVTTELRRRYGENAVVEYHGGVPHAQRGPNIQRFQDGKAHYLVGTPHAGGRGITLTAARQVIYYSNTENLDHRLQSEDRAHRIGQHWPVTYTDLAVPESMDTQIVTNLRNKIDVSTIITGDQWKEWVV